MNSRPDYSKLAPKPYAALIALSHYLNTETVLEATLLGLIYLRASMINRCGFCVGLHTAELERHNEPQSRIEALAQWETSDAFTLRERAALAWTDAVTNIQESQASDADYTAVNQFFTGKDLADLTWAIVQINAWNRMGIAFGMKWNPSPHSSSAHDRSQNVLAVGEDGGKVAEDK